MDAKAEAVRCWTNDPCGDAPGEPGSAPYAEALFRIERVEYAPWMQQFLGYAEAAGLDVLDVGCGQGLDLIGFARGGANVTGIDLTPRHVELANRHLAALGLPGAAIVGDAEQLPFADDSFDVVTSNGVLHHTPDMAAALREIRRVLRPDGVAKVIVYHRDSLHYWLSQRLHAGLIQRTGALRDVERSSVDAHPLVHVYSRRELRALLRAAGFADISLSVRHYHPGDAYGFTRLHRWGLLTGDRARDLIGNTAGWYLCAAARGGGR